MRWNGETMKQREDREAKWHRVFAWLPEQMTEGDDAGKWIWLEHYERRIMLNMMRTAWIIERRTIGTPDRATTRPATPPPPPPYHK